MGYYSIVALECDKNVYDRIREKAMICAGGPDIYFNESHETYFLKWDWVKWYSWDPAIKSFMDELKELRELMDDGAESGTFSFLEIGETDEGLDFFRMDSGCDFYPDWNVKIELPQGYKMLDDRPLDSTTV